MHPTSMETTEVSFFIELQGNRFGSCATWDALPCEPVSFQVLIMVLPGTMLRSMEN